MEFKDYLKKLRVNNKYSIRQLAMKSGVSHTYLSNIEKGDRGTPSPEVLKRLHKPLKVEFDEMMRMAGHIDQRNEDEFIDDVDLELTDEEILMKYNLTVDGESLSLDDSKEFIAFVRAKRNLKQGL